MRILDLKIKKNFTENTKEGFSPVSIIYNFY